MRGGSVLRSVALSGALIAAVALAADVVVLEDWGGAPVGTTGVPPGWQKQAWGGAPKYDFTLIEPDGQRLLHLYKAGDSSNIAKDIMDKEPRSALPLLDG